MNKGLVFLACILIALAIISGAVAAHALEKVLSEALAENWHTASEYQMYGGMGLLVVGLAANTFSFNLRWFALLLTAGIVLFSGGLYLYCFKTQVPSFTFFARVVPFGGAMMIVAWILLAIQVWRKN